MRSTSEIPPETDQSKRILTDTLRSCLIAFAGGTLYAAALPPFNWGLGVIGALAVLYYAVAQKSWKMRFFCGWMWGCGWSVFAYQFLREIHPAVPYLLMPVISLWPGVFAVTLHWMFRVIDDDARLHPAGKAVLQMATAGAWFAILEWTRCYLFVWNDLSVTVWQYPLLMQIARITGRYGIAFLLAASGWTLYALIRKKAAWHAAVIVLLMWGGVCAYGAFRLSKAGEFRDPVTLKAALIQADLPQMRRASVNEVFQAINTYVDMSRKLLDQQSADVVMWPECAVPIPLRSNSAGGAYYRYMLSKLTGTALLIGTLDFTDDGSGMTNGAVLIDRNGELAGKYAKYHRVPFGEYVPFREFLPQFMIKTFDMGRDLTAGKALEPVTLNPDIRIGTAICYEGVFSYVTAALADNRANVLAALSNDVWYPRSSEPEQHLANVVMRCVETGLPMIRCSNNGGSGVVTAEGEFRQYIGTRAERPELLRETASGVVEVTIEKNPELTVFVRFGNWFIYLLAAGLFAEMYALLFRSRKRSRTHARG